MKLFFFRVSLHFNKRNGKIVDLEILRKMLCAIKYVQKIAPELMAKWA